ncbi:MAG: hypothetical protein IJZ36_03810 [Bacilli bacterium]|nr:hypothetical protein [Bacilli bacterium]
MDSNVNSNYTLNIIDNMINILLKYMDFCSVNELDYNELVLLFSFYFCDNNVYIKLLGLVRRYKKLLKTTNLCNFYTYNNKLNDVLIDFDEFKNTLYEKGFELQGVDTYKEVKQKLLEKKMVLSSISIK